jgi:hypothetical protein
VQHITYNEWLPVVLGKPVIEIFELELKPTGFQNNYNDSVNPTLANAVATAAFRFGHSLVRNSLTRCTKDFKVPNFINLRFCCKVFGQYLILKYIKYVSY